MAGIDRITWKTHMEKFQFIYDDIFLIAFLNEKKGIPELILQKIKILEEDPKVDKYYFTVSEKDSSKKENLVLERFYCYYSGINDVPLKKFTKYTDENEYPVFNKSNSVLEREGDLDEIYDKRIADFKKVEPEKLFNEFKSWVAKIAQEGMGLFKPSLNDGNEENSENSENWYKLMNPIQDTLFRTLNSSKKDFLLDYLHYIKENLKEQEKNNQQMMTLILTPLLNLILLNYHNHIEYRLINDNYKKDSHHSVYKHKKYNEIMTSVFDFNPPFEIFIPLNHEIRKEVEDKLFYHLRHPDAIKIKDFKQVFTLSYDKMPSWEILHNPNISRYNEFYTLFFPFHEYYPMNREAMNNLRMYNQPMYRKYKKKFRQWLEKYNPYRNLPTSEQEKNALIEISLGLDDVQLVIFQLIDDFIPKKPFLLSNHSFKIEEGHIIELSIICPYGTSITKYIGEFRYLKELKLDLMNLTFINNSIGKLDSLTSLEITGNNLESIPETIGNLDSLTSLEITSNNLESIPENIGNLKLLKKIEINGRSLQELPESIGNLENLEEIKLFDTRSLKKLPTSISKLKNLTRFYYSGLKNNLRMNYIEEIKKFRNLSNLKTLRLGNIHLRYGFWYFDGDKQKMDKETFFKKYIS